MDVWIDFAKPLIIWHSWSKHKVSISSLLCPSVEIADGKPSKYHLIDEMSAQIKEIQLTVKKWFRFNRFGRAMLFGSIELCEYFKKLFYLIIATKYSQYAIFPSLCIT